MKVWYQVSELRRLVGIITDVYVNYLEIKDIKTGEYFILHESKVELIK